jgi:hypothetical protein
VHAPISTTGLTEDDLPRLKEQVHQTIANKLAEYGYKQ